MKTLKQILEVYSPKSADEKRFVKKHITVKNADVAGNGDDVFTASNIKTIDRAKEKKGYDAKSAEAVYEEEQIDELSKTTLGSYIKKASRDRGMHGIEAGAAGYKSKEQKSSIDKMKKRQAGVVKAVDKMTEEHQDLLADINDTLVEEMLNEVLAKDADAGDYISDFVKSDNPKFAGKSKAKRIKMALGAYYSKQRGE